MMKPLWAVHVAEERKRLKLWSLTALQWPKGKVTTGNQEPSQYFSARDSGNINGIPSPASLFIYPSIYLFIFKSGSDLNLKSESKKKARNQISC